VSKGGAIRDEGIAKKFARQDREERKARQARFPNQTLKSPNSENFERLIQDPCLAISALFALFA
jgi:hypothetical protein